MAESTESIMLFIVPYPTQDQVYGGLRNLTAWKTHR